MIFSNSFSILIHGYTLLAHSHFTNISEIGSRSWDNVAWGDIKNNSMGRVPFGVFLALKYKPIKLIFGTGASCVFNEKPISRSDWIRIGKPLEVEWEADFTFKYLLENFEILLKFDKLKNAINENGGLLKSQKYIESIHVLENKSKNSEEEIIAAINICSENDIKYLLRVTNPSHEPRCVSIQNNYLKRYTGLFQHVFSLPCETDFSDNEEVLIFEPQSGPGKRVEYSPCKILKSFFLLSNAEKTRFLKDTEDYFKSKIKNENFR
jgi:hypothetical protein